MDKEFEENTLDFTDDDKSIRLLYEKEFSDEGYEVILCSNGREAIRKAKTEKPNLVIMDIRMSGMDGIEAMGEIIASNRKLPIVVNTAYGIYKDNFLTWPAEVYVIKSSDLTELKETVATI